MKRFLFSVTAAALALASCMKEPAVAGGSEVEVNFSALLEDAMTTRAAYSDGSQAVKLTYYVYGELNGESTLIPNLTGTVPVAGGTANISLKLINGKIYSIFFWADAKGLGAEGNPFSYQADLKTVVVDYNGAQSQDESRDAFYGYVGSYTANGPASNKVVLKRPFAQINIGTDDMGGEGVDGFVPASAKMTVSGVSETLNVATGVTGEENAEVTFSAAAIPSGEAFPVPGYNYIAMNYVLASAEKTTVDVKLDCGAASGVMEFSNIPVQRNYRTNIYGSLFTSKNDWEVEINPEYVWNGTATKEVAPVTKDIEGVPTTVYVVKAPAELAWIAAQTNSGALLDAYIELSADIDLNNQDWIPIANTSRTDGSPAFTGTFDGNGFKVSNLKSTSAGDGYGCGLISVARDALVKNVTVSGGELASEDFAGAVVGFIGGTSTVENCKNEGVYVSGTQAAGGIVGRAYGTSTVRNCENSGEVSGTQKVGGIVGIASVSGFEIDSCTNTGKVSGVSNAGSGGILGYAGKPGTITNSENSGEVCVGETDSKYAGGICGYVMTAGVEISSCVNRGAVSGIAAGGIMGAPGNKYGTDVVACENFGAVSAKDIAGGIAGSVGDGELSSCINHGAVTAVNIAGGVAGTKVKGLMKGNLGGSASVSAPIKGRILGACRAGSGELLTMSLEESDDADNAHSAELGSVGAVGTYSTLASIKVVGGTLAGVPQNASGSSANIYIEGAAWDAYPGEIGHWVASPNSSVWTKQGSGTPAVKVNGASYTNLADALAAQTKDSVLEITDESVWPGETPLYCNGEFKSTLKDAVTAAFASDTEDKVITCRPGSDVGVMTHTDVTGNLTIYGNGATVSGGEHDFSIDIYKPLTKDITLNIYNLDGCAAWGQRRTDYKITLNFYNCKNMNRIYFTGDKGEIEMNLDNCSFVGGVNRNTSCCVKTDSKGVWSISNTYFERVAEAVAMTNENGFGKVVLTDCVFKNCGTKALAEENSSTAWASAVRSLGRQPAEIVIDACTFESDSELNSADIVIGELRPDKGASVYSVSYSIKNTKGTLKVIKPHGVVEAIDASDSTLSTSDVKVGTNE